MGESLPFWAQEADERRPGNVVALALDDGFEGRTDMRCHRDGTLQYRFNS